MTFFVLTAGDLANIALVSVVVLVAMILYMREAIRQALCKHERFGINETSRCDAICRGCGKNLGFIDSVRKARAAPSALSSTEGEG